MRRGVSRMAVRLLALCVLSAALLVPLSASAGSTGWIGGTVRGPDGSPLAGMKVQAWFLQVDSEWYTYGAPVTTLANGQYTISGLPGGRTYAVEFKDDSGAYVSEFYNDLRNGRAEEASHFPLLADQVIEPVDATLGPAGTITGTVRNSDGEPVQDVTVNAYQHFGGSVAITIAADDVTGADGTYTLAGLGGGSYALQYNQGMTSYGTHFRSDAPTSGAVRKENATPVSVSVGTTVTGVDETMLKYGRLGGTVYGTGGVALNAVAVDTFRAEGGAWPQQSESALSDVNGAYLTNQQLYPGTYRVLFTASGYPIQYHLNAVPIEYAADVVISEDATTSLDTTLLAGDGTPPESTTTPLPAGWVRHDVTASLSATDGEGNSGVGAIYWRLDSSPTTAYSVPVTISEEGTRTFAFWAVDRFGNVEPTNTEQVLIDKTPPVTSSDATSTWRSTGVTVSLTAGDALSGVDRTFVSTDGVVYTEYDAAGVWVADEGTTTVDFYSVDAAENTETVRHATVRIDTTPPTTTASGFTDGAWRNTTATVSLLPADGGSGIGSTWYSVDSVPASGTAFDVGGEGAHTIEWGSVDAVGNHEATRQATINIDATPPSTTASGFVDGAWRATSADVTLTPSEAGGSGLAGTWFSVDSVVGSGTAFTVSGSGTHAVEYGSVDSAGNRETTHTATISIDTSPPVTGASGFVDGAWRNTTATVSLLPADGGSGIGSTWYSVDSVPASGTTFTVGGAGAHTIEWGSVDALGTRETTRSATVNIDLTPPVTTANAYGGSGAFTISPSDTGGSGLAGTWYSLDGGGWTAGTSIVAAAGAHTVSFYSADNAGNSETPVGPVAFTVAGASDPPTAPVGVEVARESGSDRYATAVRISRETFPNGGVSNVVLATGEGFADALAASGLAGAVSGPLLLTPRAGLDAGVSAELARLGATKVYVVGGTGAVSDAVANTLKAKYTVERVSGSNRYDTAARIARKVAALKGGVSTAFIARGDDFADALAVSPFAASRQFPVLLVQPTSVPAQTESAIRDLRIGSVVIAGGTGAVSSGVASRLSGLGASVTRVSGSNRYDTAARIASHGISQGWGTPSFCGVATGANYADALGGGVSSGLRGGVLLLTEPTRLSAPAESFLSSNKASIQAVSVFGGTGAVSNGVLSAIDALL